jgi:ABC-type polysaccharide/polyol phosphate transport system ATPase subunit
MAKIFIKNVSVNIPIFDINSKRFFSLNKNIKSNEKVGGNKILENNNINVQALTDINLEIKNKERVGLIGHNGAGKTTLLKLLSGIYRPSIGEFKIDGIVSNLMKPGDIFLEDATGYENIRRMLFYYKQKISDFNYLIEEISEFSELGQYMNLPIKTYSSGMLTRLSFAIATSFVPEITLIDEDFGTGDNAFKNKAQQRMNEYLSKSSIIIIASHDRSIIEENCDKCVLLKKGHIEMFDSSEKVLNKYYG